MFIIYRPTVTLLLHNFDLFRTCRSSFCTVAWQLARFQLTRRIARSLGDSRAFCHQTSRQLVTSRSRLGLGRKGLVHIISGEYTENTTVLLPVKKPDQQLAATLCESGSPQISAEVSARLQYREYGTKTGVTGVVSLSEK